MKKLIVLFAVLISMNMAYSSPYTQTINNLENVLYGYQYSNETDAGRISRIEETVYGKASSGDINMRINKLKTDLSAELIGKEITPVEDTFREETEDSEYIASNPDIQYPAVDELEMKVFNQTFQKKEIKKRLTELEQKTFGKTYSDDLSTRVDRLKAQIRPQSLMNNNIAQSSNSFFDENEVIPLEKDYHLDRYESPQKFDYNAYNSSRNPMGHVSLNTVEHKILKQSFQNDTMQKRLSRLENAMFGTQFSDDDEQSRINRITSAYKANKSSAKYDSNKFSQGMGTALQIGTIILMVLACIL